MRREFKPVGKPVKIRATTPIFEVERITKVAEVTRPPARDFPEIGKPVSEVFFEVETKPLTKPIEPMAGLEIGEIIAADVSRAGRKLAVMSQVRRTIDGGVVAGNEILKETLNSKELRDTLESEIAVARKAKRFSYGQNVWKRMLVSSPATTAANVMGFGQFFTGQVVADTMSSGLLMVGAAGR